MERSENDPSQGAAPVTTIGATLDALTEEDLKRQKLRLEIAELRRSPWLKPGTMIPIVATVATLAISQSLGVFDVAQKRLDIQNREIFLENKGLERTKAELRQSVEKLSIDQASLRVEAERLEIEKTGIQTDIDTLTKRLSFARESEMLAKQRAASAEQQVTLAYASFQRLAIGRLMRELEVQCTQQYVIDLNLGYQSGAMPAQPALDHVLNVDHQYCFKQIQNEASQYLVQLKSSDLAFLEGAVANLAKQLDMAKQDFRRVYADPKVSPVPDSARLAVGASKYLEKNLKGLPTEPAELEEWIARSRRQFLRSQFGSMATNAIRQLASETLKQ